MPSTCPPCITKDKQWMFSIGYISPPQPSACPLYTLHTPLVHPPCTPCMPSTYPLCTLHMLYVCNQGQNNGCFQLATCPHHNPLHALCMPSAYPIHTLHVQPRTCFQLATCPHHNPLHTLCVPTTCPRRFLIGYMSPPHPIILLESRT